MPQTTGAKKDKMRLPSQSLFGKSIALLFSKRSTRTRLAAETSVEILGGKTVFLGKDDIQLGVNESLRDSARIIGGMCQGIFARVGEHEEIEVQAFFSSKIELEPISLFYFILFKIGISQALPCASAECSFIIVASNPNPSRFVYST